MIRIAWLCLVAFLALVATGAGLDRQARTDQFLAAFVPGPLRSSAQQVMVDQALARGTPQEALAGAAALVRRRPMPAENLLALGLAQQRAGQNEIAVMTIQAAARRGWRVARIQEFQMKLALAAGEPGEAANRLAALWAIDGDRDDLGEISQPVLATSAGRKAFAEQVAATRKWQDNFLRIGHEALAPGTFAEIAGGAIKAGAQFDCALLSESALSLAQQGQVGPAGAVWSGPCARRTAANAPRGPFEWFFPEHPLVTRDIGYDSKGWSMDYDNADQLLQPLATRTLRLPPGNHTVALAFGQGDSIPRLTVSCLGGAGRNASLASLRGKGMVGFAVPASGCAAQALSLGGDAGSRKALRISID